MRKKNGVYKFWTRPFMAGFVLFGVIMFTAALIAGAIVGIDGLIGNDNDVIGIVLYIIMVGFFALASAFALFMGIRYYWLRVIIDYEKIVIKSIFAKKTLTECKIADIKRVEAKYINREAKFIIIKDGRRANPKRTEQKDGYVCFAYTKKRLKFVQTFWTGYVYVDFISKEF